MIPHLFEPPEKPSRNPNFISLNEQHYAGYIRVREQPARHLYFYFATSERSLSDPVVLWLNGGPGCSSFDGWVYEHGPFELAFETPPSSSGTGSNGTRRASGLCICTCEAICSLPTTSRRPPAPPTPAPKVVLRPNPYSWNKVANVIYLDSPASEKLGGTNDRLPRQSQMQGLWEIQTLQGSRGQHRAPVALQQNGPLLSPANADVGMSYSENSTDVARDDIQTAEDSHAFLRKFFTHFSSFQRNKFFVSGESYAGIYVPTLALAGECRLWGRSSREASRAALPPLPCVFLSRGVEC